MAELEAGRDLRLGEYSEDPTLNLSEARIIVARSLETRNRHNGEMGKAPVRDSETVVKTKEYLDLFATFKEMGDAQQAEHSVNTYSQGMERFERSQMGSLVPTNADEAKALIPSLEKKVEEGLVNEADLEALCIELNKIKRQAQL